MRQHLFTARLKSLVVVFGIAMAFASCANEDVAQNPTNPNEDNDKNLTTFVAGDETKTRTSMDYNSGDFYWEAGDYIYVKDDNNVWQKSTNAPNNKVASFKYKVPGKFTASTSYKVYYFGQTSSGGCQAKIPNEQYQSGPDHTNHFATSGDYGSATANKITGKQQFQFTLEHQPAYLVFQPYTSNTALQNCYLTKIEVTSDNNIAETYTLNTSTDNLDASAGGKQIVLATDGGTTYHNGFPLTNSTANRTTNGAYMIIKPGTHTLKVRYWVLDPVTRAEGTITKLLPSTTFASNTYYDVTANLNVPEYDGDHYYMWDAKEQYWKGYEWTKHLPSGTGQPTLTGDQSGNYAQNNSDSRYYHEGGGVFQATQSCANLPNINEMTWYAAKGDPHWDMFGLWATMGHLYTGGVWLKKRAYISGYNKNTAVDGTDWRTIPHRPEWSVSNTLPSAAEASKYFYLPALGHYDEHGMALGFFNEAYYWTSSSHPWGNDYGYGICFQYGKAKVYYCYRNEGLRVAALE